MPSRALLFMFALLLAWPAAGAAAEEALPPARIRIDQLIGETQKTSSSTEIVDMVWWIPSQFWAAALAKDEGVPEASRREILELFDKYTVVAAVHGRIGSFGVSGFTSEAEVRKSLRLVDAEGTEHAPLAEDRLDPRLMVVTQILRPMLANTIGQMGSNLNFYAFPARRKDGRPVADPLCQGRLTVHMMGNEYAFRLPLGSLLPPRHDPQTGEVFPGSYRFNPYTGTALDTVPAGH